MAAFTVSAHFLHRRLCVAAYLETHKLMLGWTGWFEAATCRGQRGFWHDLGKTFLWRDEPPGLIQSKKSQIWGLTTTNWWSLPCPGDAALPEFCANSGRPARESVPLAVLAVTGNRHGGAHAEEFLFWRVGNGCRRMAHQRNVIGRNSCQRSIESI